MRSLMVMLLAVLVTGVLVMSSYCAGTEGLDSLKIGLGARPSGMGGAYVGVSDDSNAVFWNPAGLTQISKREVSAMFMSYVSGIICGNASYAQPTDKGTFSGSIVYLTTSLDKTGITAGGEVIDEGKTFSAGDTSIMLSYAKKMQLEGSDISIGGNAKLISSQLDDVTATASSLDLGALMQTEDKMQFGLVLQNLVGTDIKYAKESYSLPFVTKIGGSAKFLEKDALTVAADLSIPSKSKSGIALGAEYLIPMQGKTQVLARAGYSTVNELSGLSLGFGVKLENGLGFDLSMSSMGDFGSVIRLSAVYKFLQ